MSTMLTTVLLITGAQTHFSDDVPLAGYTVSNGYSVDFFSRQQESGSSSPAFSASRSRVTAEGGQELATISSEECPQIRDVLRGLNHLPPLEFRVAGVSERSSLSPIAPMRTEAQSYAVWGLAEQANGSFARMTMSASGGPIADFVIKAEARLASCWSEGAPAT